MQDRQRIVRSALDALAPVHREAIELAVYSGLTHTAIAEKLRQPLGAVKSWIRTGMIQMRISTTKPGALLLVFASQQDEILVEALRPYINRGKDLGKNSESRNHR